MQLLAQKGANVNSADKVWHDNIVGDQSCRLRNSRYCGQRGESALMQACGRGQVEVSKILVGHGAAVNHQSKVSVQWGIYVSLIIVLTVAMTITAFRIDGLHPSDDGGQQRERQSSGIHHQPGRRSHPAEQRKY